MDELKIFRQALETAIKRIYSLENEMQLVKLQMADFAVSIGAEDKLNQYMQKEKFKTSIENKITSQEIRDGFDNYHDRKKK
jgi:DNA polymerase III sliding clamp (beta) subunit (PCNA family)